MAKRRFIRDSDWQKQPHVKDGPPPSLWWYRRSDRLRVIDAYIERYPRGGRAMPNNFKNDIVQWLDDLSLFQKKKARFWSIPSYALAHDLEKATLMKCTRELEKIAKQLFPDSVPASRKTRTRLTEEEKEQIRQQYLEGKNAKDIAQEFRIAPSKVGHLCRKEKKVRADQRLMNESSDTNSISSQFPDDSEMPF